MRDSEPIRVKNSVRDCFGSMFGDILSKVNYKIILFLLFFFYLISSDIFVNRVLARIPDTTDGTTITNFGTMLQGITLIVMYIITEAAIGCNII